MNQEQHKIVQEAMDIHASRMAVEFNNWIYERGYYRDGRGVWFKHSGDGLAFNTDDLYNLFTQEIAKQCKNENQDASAS